MNDIVPKGAYVSIQTDLVLPVAATRVEVDEWMAFELGHSSSMSVDNPLYGYDFEAAGPPMLSGRGLYRHESVVPGVEPNTWLHRRWLSPEPFTGETARDVMGRGWAAEVERLALAKRQGA